jgi:hypothetical protein
VAAAIALTATAGWANAKIRSICEWQRKMDTGYNALNSAQAKKRIIRQASGWGNASLGGQYQKVDSQSGPFQAGCFFRNSDASGVSPILRFRRCAEINAAPLSQTWALQTFDEVAPK